MKVWLGLGRGLAPGALVPGAKAFLAGKRRVNLDSPRPTLLFSRQQCGTFVQTHSLAGATSQPVATAAHGEGRSLKGPELPWLGLLCCSPLQSTTMAGMIATRGFSGAAVKARSHPQPLLHRCTTMAGTAKAPQSSVAVAMARLAAKNPEAPPGKTPPPAKYHLHASDGSETLKSRCADARKESAEACCCCLPLGHPWKSADEPSLRPTTPFVRSGQQGRKWVGDATGSTGAAPPL